MKVYFSLYAVVGDMVEYIEYNVLSYSVSDSVSDSVSNSESDSFCVLIYSVSNSVSDSVSDSESDSFCGSACELKFDCMCVLICFFNFIIDNIFFVLGRSLYIFENLKNIDDFAFIVFGL